MRCASSANSVSVSTITSGAPSTASEATDPANMPTSKPSSSAMRAEIGSNTEPGYTQRSPWRMARKRARRASKRAISAHPHQLLQRAQLVVRLLAIENRPIRMRDFGDVDVAARIDRDAVRGDELTEPLADRFRAEMREQLALGRDDRHARAEVGHVTRKRGHRLGPELADEADRILSARNKQAARPRQIVPLPLILALAVEHLPAMVLAIGDVDVTRVVGGDVVHELELARIGARRPPREQQLAVGRVLVHARVLVAVRHVDLALRRERRVRAAIERVAAEAWRLDVRPSDRHQHLAVGRALAHRVSLVVGEVEHVVGTDRGAMRVGEADVLAPRAQKLALAIEYDDRIGAAREHVHVVFAVDAHRCAVLVAHARRQLAPSLEHLVAIGALTENYRLGGMRRSRRQKGRTQPAE